MSAVTLRRRGAAGGGRGSGAQRVRRGRTAGRTGSERGADGRQTGLRRGGRAAEPGRRRSSSAATVEATLVDADLIVLSPGVSPRQPDVGCRARGRRARHRRARARVALARRGASSRSRAPKASRRRPRWRAGCWTKAGFTVNVGGNIGVPLSAQVAASTPRRRSRRRSEQLSARDDRDLPAVDCRAAEPVGRPPGSTRERGGVRGREVAHLRQSAQRRLGRRQRGRRGRARGGARRACADGCPLSPIGAAREGVVVTAEAVRPARGRRERVLVPLVAVRLIGRHLLVDVAAAAAIADLAGRHARKR